MAVGGEKADSSLRRRVRSGWGRNDKGDWKGLSDEVLGEIREL
jgi:hypothetical protein